jgi:hypothetical protein
MLRDKLWDIAVRADWHLMSPEYEALALGGFVVAAVLIWNGIRMRKRIRRNETELQKMQKEISLLQMQESRRLLTELNVKSTEKIEPAETTRDQRANAVATHPPD